MQVRGQRDALMADTDYVITRHTEQSALVMAGKLAVAKLTKDQILEVQVYRQALRDITTQEDPYKIVWPAKPDCLS